MAACSACGLDAPLTARPAAPQATRSCAGAAGPVRWPAAAAAGSVGLHGEHTILILGITPLRVPEPLATFLHELARKRRYLSQVPAGEPGPWLFPGLHPGRPVLPVLPATISTGWPASASILWSSSGLATTLPRRVDARDHR